MLAVDFSAPKLGENTLAAFVFMQAASAAYEYLSKFRQYGFRMRANDDHFTVIFEFSTDNCHYYGQDVSIAKHLLVDADDRHAWMKVAMWERLEHAAKVDVVGNPIVVPNKREGEI